MSAARVSSNHRCFNHRQYAVFEGSDLVFEICTVCKRVRHEAGGKRPMAWYLDRTNVTGFRYAYDDPRKGQRVWKFIPALEGVECRAV